MKHKDLLDVGFKKNKIKIAADTVPNDFAKQKGVEIKKRDTFHKFHRLT